MPVIKRPGTHPVTGGSWAAPSTDFDHFMATANKVGAQPIITANYGSGTAQEAADCARGSTRRTSSLTRRR